MHYEAMRRLAKSILEFQRRQALMMMKAFEPLQRLARIV